MYVIDSGINYSHEEFEGRAFYAGFDQVPGENESRNGSDCQGHGTHVASLIGRKKWCSKERDIIQCQDDQLL